MSRIIFIERGLDPNLLTSNTQPGTPNIEHPTTRRRRRQESLTSQSCARLGSLSRLTAAATFLQSRLGDSQPCNPRLPLNHASHQSDAALTVTPISEFHGWLPHFPALHFFDQIGSKKCKGGPFSNVGNLGERSADVLVGFGAVVNTRPTRMSALRQKVRSAT